MGETAPFWRFSAASYPDLEKTMSDDDLVVKANRPTNGDASIASQVYIHLCITIEETFILLTALHAFIIIIL